MNRIVLCALCLVFGAVAAFAVPFSAELTTTGPDGEASGYTDRYAAYLCTTAEAATYFDGNATIAGVTDWLKDNYATDIGNLNDAGDEVKMQAYGFDAGEYSFTKYFQSGLAGDYLAVLTYAMDSGDFLYRVFGNTAAADGTLTIDLSRSAGNAGDWTQGAVPEPTSGLLILLGVAGLALKRKKA